VRLSVAASRGGQQRDTVLLGLVGRLAHLGDDARVFDEQRAHLDAGGAAGLVGLARDAVEAEDGLAPEREEVTCGGGFGHDGPGVADAALDGDGERVHGTLRGRALPAGGKVLAPRVAPSARSTTMSGARLPTSWARPWPASTSIATAAMASGLAKAAWLSLIMAPP